MKIKQRLNGYLASTYNSYNKLSANRKILLIQYNSLLDNQFVENPIMKDYIKSEMDRANFIKKFKVNRFIDGYVKYKLDADRLAYLANVKSINDGGIVSTIFKIVRTKLTAIVVRRDIKKLRMLIWEMGEVVKTKNDLEDYITNRFLKPDTETYQKNARLAKSENVGGIRPMGAIELELN